MTIVTALICKDAIVMASDSRTSDILTGKTRDDAQKVSVIELKGGKALIGQSGNADASARAVEILERLADGKPMLHRRTVADLAEQAVTELKMDVRKQFHGTAEELQKRFVDSDFRLMIAHYYKGNPCVFTESYSSDYAAPQSGRYVSIGCGDILADFLLKGFDIHTMEDTHAMVTAVYAVEQVKKGDLRCGGPTQVGIAVEASAEKVFLLPDDLIRSIAGELHRMEVGAEWQRKIEAVFKGIGKSKEKRSGGSLTFRSLGVSLF